MSKIGVINSIYNNPSNEARYLERINELLTKYDGEINTNDLNFDDMVSYLKQNYRVSIFDNINSISDILLSVFLKNMKEHSGLTSLDEAELNLSYITIEESDSSKRLYSNYLNRAYGEIIFILTECTSGYFYTNSTLLNSDLIELIGVSKDDLKSKNMKLLNYLTNKVLRQERELDLLI